MMLIHGPPSAEGSQEIKQEARGQEREEGPGVLDDTISAS